MAAAGASHVSGPEPIATSELPDAGVISNICGCSEFPFMAAAKQIAAEKSGTQLRPRQGFSELSGAQFVDLAWRELSRCLPQRNLERKGSSRSKMNPRIAAHAFA